MFTTVFTVLGVFAAACGVAIAVNSSDDSDNAAIAMVTMNDKNRPLYI